MIHKQIQDYSLSMHILIFPLIVIIKVFFNSFILFFTENYLIGYVFKNVVCIISYARSQVTKIKKTRLVIIL